MRNSAKNNQESGGRLSSKSSPVQEFYAGTKILVTGATGFLGKVLVEKLLRSCPKIDSIYYIVRPKRGQLVEQRHEKLLESTVFNILKKDNPAALKKLFPIAGDIAEDKLGISPDDYQMLIKNINIVFHSAATIVFTAKLETALSTNTQATAEIVQLCKKLRNVKALVYVSTAYSNSDKMHIREEVFDPPATIERVREICGIKDEKKREIASKQILGRHPNTYTFTKAIAESIVNNHAIDIPVCIVRPGIVSGSLSEPVPGWVDNFVAISGVVVEHGRGTLRSILASDQVNANVIPVDIVVNTMIAAAWRTTIEKRTDKATVYNCAISNQNPITWGNFYKISGKLGIKYPSKYIMFYPGFQFTQNRLVFYLWTSMYQVLPAIIADIYLICSFQKPYVTKMAKRIITAIDVVSFFTLREWKWDYGNIIKLQNDLKQSSSDADNFYIDVKKVNWETYLLDYVIGLREYALGDPMSTLPMARKKQYRIWWITWTCFAVLACAAGIVFYYLLMKLLFK